MSALANVLDRLGRVKQVGTGQYMAACPVCQSRKGRPLSVGEGDTAAVVINAWCGCSTETVLAALGLALADLYDKPLGHHVSPRRNRTPARDLLAMASEDADLIAVVAADVLAGRTVSETDWTQLARATRRLGEFRNHVEQ